MGETLLFCIALVIIIIIVTNIIVSASNANKKARKAVLDSSSLLHNLKSFNQTYNFYDIREEYTFRMNVEKKPKFDRFNIDDFLDDVIRNYNYDWQEIAEKEKYNSTFFPEYIETVSSLKSEMTKKKAKEMHVSFSRYLKIEKQERTKLTQCPITYCEVVCYVNYTSPQGRNSYSKHKHYSIPDVVARKEQLAKLDAQKNTEEYRRKRERSFMTDKLRYSILERDGFRCQICGRTAADGAKLHVDHIIPVSKGGRTTPDNLRTLCDACNFGKGDHIEQTKTDDDFIDNERNVL